MLYLEDYLEMIEHLPQELRDRFTEMREMDLTVQNNMDEMEKRVKIFFNDCKRCPGDLPPSIQTEYEAIKQEYRKTLEDADEKLHLANQMYELVDKYLRRLDTELHKFKCELEADNKGITEVLEKRSLELDTPISASNLSSQQQKENRYERIESSSSFRYSRPRSEKRRDSSGSNSLQTSYNEKRQAVASLPLVETRHTPVVVSTPPQPQPSHQQQQQLLQQQQLQQQQQQQQSPLPQQQQQQQQQTRTPTPTPVVTTPTQSNVSYNLGHIGAGPAIAAAASQAIAATQQMQQGRRTASLKASYEAINTGNHGHEFSIGRELAGAAQTAIQAIQQDHANNKKKQKKWSENNLNSSSSSSSAAVQAILNAPIGNVAGVSNVGPDSPSLDVTAQNNDVTDAEWTYDPNEPRYCLCNQVSYGDMVACDNEDCPMEWFHYPCVGITAPPKGKWYCPQCTASMKRRGGRKN